MKLQVIFGGRCAGRSILQKLAYNNPQSIVAEPPMILFDELPVTVNEVFNGDRLVGISVGYNSAMLQLNQTFEKAMLSAEDLAKVFQDMRIQKVAMSEERFKHEYEQRFENQQPEYDENYKVIK